MVGGPDALSAAISRERPPLPLSIFIMKGGSGAASKGLSRAPSAMPAAEARVESQGKPWNLSTSMKLAWRGVASSHKIHLLRI